MITTTSGKYTHNVSKSEFLLTLSALASLLVGGLVYQVADNIVVLIMAMLFSTAIYWVLGRFNITDPRCWVSASCFLYCNAGVILFLFGMYEPYDLNRTSGLTYLMYLSVMTVLSLLCVFNKPKIRTLETLREASGLSLVISLSKIFLALCLVGVVYNNLIFWTSGATTKREFWDVDSGTVAVAYNWMFVFYALLLCSLPFTKEKGRNLVIYIVGVASIVTWLNTGERDVIIKYFLVTIFIFIYQGAIRSHLKVVLMTALVVLLLPIMKDMGTSLHRGVEIRTYDSFFLGVLRSDFHAAARNLDILLINQEFYARHGGERLQIDIARGVLPGFLVSLENTSTWFTRQYTPIAIGRESAGLGFSLVGAFYIYGREIGIVLGGAFFGLVCWLLWVRSMNSVFWIAAYITLVPILIWSLRGDLAYILSGLTKQVGGPLFAVACVWYCLVSILRKESGGRTKMLTMASGQRGGE